MLSFDEYWAGPFHQIEGWVELNLAGPLKLMAQYQADAGITGSVLEIGVHHGRLLLALATLTASDEKVVAIDIFGQQRLNVDLSGSGNKAVFQAHVARLIGEARVVEVIEDDSLTFNLIKRQRLLERCGSFRIISIDGGHTSEHTFSDIAFAIDIMAGGAVIMVDDYYNMHWPGVNEGTNRFMFSRPSPIKPFCYTNNKIFFASYGYVKQYFNLFCEAFTERDHYRVVSMWGSPVVVFH
jgi:hypothetical protein